MSNLTLETAASLGEGAVHPAFSPDGSMLCWLHGPKICLWNRDKQACFLELDGTAPAWSPDSKSLAFALDDKIRLLRLDRNEQTPIGEGQRPCWSPTDGRLYWLSRSEDTGRVMAYEADGEAPREVAARVSPDFPWAVSRDGRLLACVRAESNPARLKGLPSGARQIGAFSDLLTLCVVDIRTGADLYKTGLPLGAVSYSTRIGWSSTGHGLVYSWELPPFGDGGRSGRETYVWFLDDAEPFRVDAGEGVATALATWSPDGRQLAFLVNPCGPFALDPMGWLTVFDVSKRSVVWQCRDEVATVAPLWSPDGHELYCRVARHVEQPHVSFSKDGKVLRRITPEGSYCGAVDLSPDGAYLAASARQFFSLDEIWMCSTQAEETHRITSASSALEGLSFPQMSTHQWTTPDGCSFTGIVMESAEASVDTPLLVFPAMGERGWHIANLQCNVGFLLASIAEQGYRVFVPCHRFTGLAGLEHIKDTWRLRAMAEDVAPGIETLRQALGSNAPVVGLGQSLSADILCEMLVSFPDQFLGVVVSGIHANLASVYAMSGSPNLGLRLTFGGSPSERYSDYLEGSPLRVGIKETRSAVLILMGADDDALSGAKDFFVALTEAGKDATFLVFEDQNHWPERPEQVATYLTVAVEWLNRLVDAEVKSSG
ncbi:MAG: PD40 domain-containing protein [Verrucomicrobia bacterium]|nr:PD40 domain-containing protein [Verrucomicrobiota bacterium]